MEYLMSVEQKTIPYMEHNLKHEKQIASQKINVKIMRKE